MCCLSSRPARISCIFCRFHCVWLLEVRRQKVGIHHSKRPFSKIPVLHVNSVSSGFQFQFDLIWTKFLPFFEVLCPNTVLLRFFGSVFVPLVIPWSCGMCKHRSAAECGSGTLQLPLVTRAPARRAAWNSSVCQVGLLSHRSRIWSSRAGTSHFVQTTGSLL